MANDISLQKLRQEYHPKLPEICDNLSSLTAIPRVGTEGKNENLADIFPKTLGQPILDFSLGEEEQSVPMCVGVVLSGGQAAGGHNVITGLYDALIKFHPQSRLFGFLNGPKGIIENNFIELKEESLHCYRNQGGFDLLGAGRSKIETPEHFRKAAETVKGLNLDGIVIIGGDDSNTNAALLAEYFQAQQIRTRVIGVPKTIDGDLKNAFIEISFGFDTATKVFSEIIGNILRDALSAKKYYFFIKLMGRSASHIALECALQTHPNLTLIGEEIEKKQQTFQQLTDQICDVICSRANHKKNYGVILIPEGLIEFIPEMKQLIHELNQLQVNATLSKEEKIAAASEQLSQPSTQCFLSLPTEIQAQLLLDRDPHGNVKVSQIETERLFIESVKKELGKRKNFGTYSGVFHSQPFFCGYEGRSCLPSNFDCNYCYALGHVAALLIRSGATGYMGCVQQLASPVESWKFAGIPLASMVHIEQRKGQPQPVIEKALVDLQGIPFRRFSEQRGDWVIYDDYRYPGPIQFFGPSELTDRISMTLAYESIS